tara:strand:- start:315 stop:485 length:171 start_codon:yes stop_codon:yes gene_type:complete
MDILSRYLTDFLGLLGLMFIGFIGFKLAKRFAPENLFVFAAAFTIIVVCLIAWSGL